MAHARRNALPLSRRQRPADPSRFLRGLRNALFDRPALRAGMLGIRSGTFDDPARYRPQAAIFIAHAPPRDRMLDATAESGSSPCLPQA